MQLGPARETSCSVRVSIKSVSTSAGSVSVSHIHYKFHFKRLYTTCVPKASVKMVLKYDSEFEVAAGPILAMAATMTKPAVHDVEARRVGVKATFGTLMAAMPDAPDVQHTAYKVKSTDGIEVLVTKKAKVNLAAGPPGPAVLHIHGGGMIAGDTEMFTKPVNLQASLTGIP